MPVETITYHRSPGLEEKGGEFQQPHTSNNRLERPTTPPSRHAPIPQGYLQLISRASSSCSEFRQIFRVRDYFSYTVSSCRSSDRLRRYRINQSQARSAKMRKCLPVVVVGEILSRRQVGIPGPIHNMYKHSHVVSWVGPKHNRKLLEGQRHATIQAPSHRHSLVEGRYPGAGVEVESEKRDSGKIM